jgi:hypothetical protein
MTTPKTLGGMGFRDFVLFNQAMLGKQCWRLVTEPESLCARVLKGRYFPETDFLSPVKPRASSYTRRSILFGRELLLKGIRWGVGNGQGISILQDSWIPRLQSDTFKTVEDLPPNSKVSFLLNDRADHWDMDKVNFFFTPEMARAIQQIPVSRHGGDDFISWPHAKFGLYTVKSAHNLARTGKSFAKRYANDRGDSSDLSNQEKQWKSIWSITSPEKMKIVVWRMVRDCLPTGFQLQHRKIPAEDQCVFCGLSERVEHIFLFCPWQDLCGTLSRTTAT